MKRLMPLLLLPLLAACAHLPPELGGPEPVVEPEGPKPVPAEVAAHLPPGVPGEIVMLDVNGCYVFSIEVTDPQVGFPVLDRSGNQVCPAPAQEGEAAQQG